MFLVQEVIPAPDSVFSLFYFLGAALITVGIEALRRWVKHRMDIWEANHPIPKEGGDDDKRTSSD